MHLGWDWHINVKDSALIKNDENDSEPNKAAEKSVDLNVNPKVNFDKPIKNGPTTHGFDYSFGFAGL